MQTTENRIHLSKTEFIYHTHDPRYVPKYAASSKNGKLFVADFSDFYLAASASENDANQRKPNSFITSVTRDMGQNMLPAVKTEKNFVANFSDFYLAVSASVNDANHRKPNSFITSVTQDMGQNMLPAVKTENVLSPIFFFFFYLEDR